MPHQLQQVQLSLLSLLCVLLPLIISLQKVNGSEPILSAELLSLRNEGD